MIGFILLFCSNNDDQFEWMRRIDSEIEGCMKIRNYKHASLPDRSYEVRVYSLFM